MQVRPKREKPQLKPQRVQGQRIVPLQKGPGELQEGTNQYQNSHLQELGKVLRGTPVELPHLKSCTLEEGALIYVPADQQSSQWLIRAIDNYRLGSGAILKATEAMNLPEPVKVALRTRDRVAQSQIELRGWIQNLNLGLHMENWRVLSR
jgi:hypothetical protein